MKNFIGGRFVLGSGGEGVPSGSQIDVFEPATGKVFVQAPRSGSEDVNQAITAAHGALEGWAALSPNERAGWLRRVAAAIEAQGEKLAVLESRNTGKPLRVAREVDIQRSIDNFNFFADAATQFSSESHVTDPTTLHYTLRQPVGVVTAISPWNLPLYLLTWKIAPALAAGNTVVAKPSEVTPATADALAQICAEIGFPPGVLNIVHGYGPELGPALVRDPRVKAVTFTGSTRVGQEIAAITGGLLKKTSLELGGKNPFIVFKSADLDLAVTQAVRAGFSNQGQICLCGSRVLVEKEVYEDFKTLFVERVRRLKVGDPNLADTDQGALVSKAHFKKVEMAVARARSEGGKILCGGEPIKGVGRCAEGWFFSPTVVEMLGEALGPNCVSEREEIFGPVVTLSSFESEKEALHRANSVDYGLSASVFTRDLSQAHRMARDLECGLVWINSWMRRDLRTPFGGKKASGMGREGGWEAMRFFTEPKNVTVQI